MSPLVYARADGRIIRVGDGANIGSWTPGSGGGPDPTFILGEDKAATIAASGVRPTTLPARIPVTGNIVTTADGQIIENKQLTNGWIEDRHNNTIVRNCEVNYGTALLQTFNPPTQAGIFRIGAKTGSLYQNVFLNPSTPTVNTYGVVGSGYIMEFCEIINTVDNVQINTGGQVIIRGCYLHSGRYYTVDPRQTDGSHSDVIQILIGADRQIIGNVLDTGTVTPNARTNGANSSGFGVLVSPSDTTVRNIKVDLNWFLGDGFSHVKLGEQSRGLITPLIITNNRFEGDTDNPQIHGTATTINAALAAGTIAGNTGPNGLALASSEIWADPATA